MSVQTRYLEPGPLARVFNAIVRLLTRMGVSLWGSRVLSVRGRRTGRWRRTPVNLLTVGGEDYLVSPRGNTQWVRNLRAAGSGELRVGRRVRRFRAVETSGAEQVAVLRAYLARWAWEAGVFFGDLDADSGDEHYRRAAPGHPVFRLVPPVPERR